MYLHPSGEQQHANFLEVYHKHMVQVPGTLCTVANLPTLCLELVTLNFKKEYSISSNFLLLKLVIVLHLIWYNPWRTL